MDEPTITHPAAPILAGLPAVSPDELATWPAGQRDAYLAARAELASEADQLQAVVETRSSPEALLADVLDRAATVKAARVYEQNVAAADKAYRAAVARFGGEDRLARIDLLDGTALGVRTPSEPEVADLERKVLRLGDQADRTKAAAETAEAQRWAWEKCIAFGDIKGAAAKYPLIWGDIARAYNALGRGVRDARRGKA